ncbi:MAG: 50S ribosomal protein L9 [Lachnospirales bacterium]
MKVILQEDIKGVGKKGDVINASDGHARNYLLPKGLAVEANKGNINQLERTKHNEEVQRAENLAAAKSLKEDIEKVVLTMAANAGESGKLFGTITNKEIGKSLEEEHNIKIDKKKIVLKRPIKNIGEFHVDIKLHPKVVASLKVVVK